jgi:hypothetical protein
MEVADHITTSDENSRQTMKGDSRSVLQRPSRCAILLPSPNPVTRMEDDPIPRSEPGESLGHPVVPVARCLPTRFSRGHSRRRRRPIGHPSGTRHSPARSGHPERSAQPGRYHTGPLQPRHPGHAGGRRKDGGPSPPSWLRLPVAINRLGSKAVAGLHRSNKSRPKKHQVFSKLEWRPRPELNWCTRFCRLSTVAAIL